MNQPDLFPVDLAEAQRELAEAHPYIEDFLDEEYDADDYDPYEAAGESPFSLPGGGRSL